MIRVGVEVQHECNEGMKQKCNWEHGLGREVDGGRRGGWLLGLLQCTVWHLNIASRFTRAYSCSLGVHYNKKMISQFENELRLVIGYCYQPNHLPPSPFLPPSPPPPSLTPW